MASVAGKRGEISGKSKGSMAADIHRGHVNRKPCLRSRWPFLWPTQELSRRRASWNRGREGGGAIKLHLNNVAGDESVRWLEGWRGKLHRYGKKVRSSDNGGRTDSNSYTRYTGRPLHGVRILDNCTAPLEWSYTLITTITDVFDNNLACPPVLLNTQHDTKSFKRFREGFKRLIVGRNNVDTFVLSFRRIAHAIESAPSS